MRIRFKDLMPLFTCSKIAIYGTFFSPNFKRSLQPPKDNIQYFKKTWIFLNFFLFLWVIPCWIRIRIPSAGADPATKINADPGSETLSCMNIMFLLFRDRMGISKQELVSMLEEDELKDAILGKRRIFFPSLPCSSFHKCRIPAIVRWVVIFLPILMEDWATWLLIHYVIIQTFRYRYVRTGLEFRIRE